MIVLAGFVVSLILIQSTFKPREIAIIIGILGVLSLAVGFFFRNWFIISKILGTSSMGMICNGISILVFSILSLIIDIQGKTNGS